MKKFVVVILSFIAVLCVFTIAFQWYFNPSRWPEKSHKEIIKGIMSSLDDTNAARYYLMACLSLAELPEDDSTLLDRLDEVLEKGWHEDDPALADYVRRNEPALELVRKGNEQATCLFPFQDERSHIAPLSNFRHIARLFTAKAELHQRDHAFDKAMESYSDSLEFSVNLSNAAGILHALTGYAMEGLVFSSLGTFVAHLNDEAVCRKLLDDVITVEGKSGSLHDLLKREFDSTNKLYQDWARGILFFSGMFGDAPNVFERLMDTAIRACGYAAMRISSWWILRQQEAFNRAVLEESVKPYPEIAKGGFLEGAAQSEVEQVRLEMIRNILISHERFVVKRRANTVRVALHLYFLQHGRYPESLEELLEFVPETILTDPFSME